MITTQEAFAALLKAGLKHDDPDLVRLFDLEAPDFVAAAKKAKPDLFEFNALTASKAEYATAYKVITCRDVTRPQPASPQPGFDAMRASAAEYKAELDRMGLANTAGWRG